MKKFIIPLGYIIIAILLSFLYGFFYQHLFTEVPHVERGILIQTVMGLISLVAPAYLLVTVVPFLKNRVLLLAIPVLMTVITATNILRVRSQFNIGSAFGYVLDVFVIFLVLGIGMTWMILYLLEQKSSLTKTSFLVAAVFRFIILLFSNQFSMRLVFQRLDDIQQIERYILFIRSASIFEGILIAFVLFALYKDKEDSDNAISEYDPFHYKSTSTFE